MKAIIPLFLFFFLLSIPLNAQTKYPKHSLKIGFGNSGFRSVDFQGKTRYLEYNRQLFNRFSIGLDGNWSKANNFKDTDIEKKMDRLSGNTHLFFSPIQKQNAAFKLGFGPSFYTAKYNFENLDPEGKNDIPANYSEQDYGFSVALDFEIFVIKNWSLGTRASYQQYKQGDKVYFWGFNTGIRF